jgi:hypothetical protein
LRNRLREGACHAAGEGQADGGTGQKSRDQTANQALHSTFGMAPDRHPCKAGTDANRQRKLGKAEARHQNDYSLLS